MTPASKGDRVSARARPRDVAPWLEDRQPQAQPAWLVPALCLAIFLVFWTALAIAPRAGELRVRHLRQAG